MEQTLLLFNFYYFVIMEKLLVCYNKDADKITSNLWVGNRYSARCLSFLKDNNITLVINCTQHLPIPEFYQEHNINSYRVPVQDSNWQEDQDIMHQHVDNVVSLIDKHLAANKGVLVHCHAGIQRSATMALSYLLWKAINKQKMVPSRKFMYWMKLRRPGVFEPRPSFTQFIREYEQKLVQNR